MHLHYTRRASLAASRQCKMFASISTDVSKENAMTEHLQRPAIFESAQNTAVHCIGRRVILIVSKLEST